MSFWVPSSPGFLSFSEVQSHPAQYSSNKFSLSLDRKKKKKLGSRQWREKESGKPLGRLFCGNISVYTGMNLHKGRGWGGSPVGSQNSNVQNK